MQEASVDGSMNKDVFLNGRLQAILPASIRGTQEAQAVAETLKQVASYNSAASDFIRQEIGDGMGGRIPDYCRLGYLRSIAQLYAPGQAFETSFVNGWTFPDGHRDTAPWTVFSQEGRTKALVSQFVDIAYRPVLTLSVLQGLPKEPVRLADVAQQLIRSWRPLFLTDWGLQLRVPEMQSEVYRKIRDIFFHRQPVKTVLPGYPSQHRINLRKQATRKALEIG